jgi:hypothetical protein
MRYRILAEHKYIIEAYVYADTLAEAEQTASELTIMDYEPMTPTLDEMENEYITIINIEED